MTGNFRFACAGIISQLLLCTCLFQCRLQAQITPAYTVNNDTIIGYNTGRYNNRPLYINNTNAFILAGDQPLIRFAKADQLFGNLYLSCKRNGSKKRLIDFDQVTSKYVPGQMNWQLSDSKLPGTSVQLTTMPAADNIGMVVCVAMQSALPGDTLIWDFGGARHYKDKQLSWEFDVMGHAELLQWKDTNGDESSDHFHGELAIKKQTEHYYFSFSTNADGKLVYTNGAVAKGQFENAQSSRIELGNRLKINTPDTYLNAAAGASVMAINGTWYPPVFVHGCMQWNVRLPGWRTMFGGIAYGWHDRAKEEAKFYIDGQVKKSNYKQALADTALLLTGQTKISRFYGVGRIDKDQDFYDMQSQFFDQLVEEYRWTNDPELIEILRNALELHLTWIQQCFDPDNDGVYESYMNTWPTDSQWYNGGGTAEETSYAYRGHKAARDMARNAGDKVAEAYHTKMLEKIKTGFFSKLWINDKGHSGAYREQGGHERLHKDPWLYSIFLPIDAGLTNSLQSLESVYYSEWALQNDTLPFGGRQVWTSNWVPGIWSVRELWPGDNYALALAYFQSGLASDGYNIFRGTFMRTAFNHLVPGNFGGIQGGIDFGDCVHPFARTLVQGLFGYNPDYPNGAVTIAPQFPAEWQYASIAIPDVSVDFKKQESNIRYSLELKKKANLVLSIAVQCKKIRRVTNNGEPVSWQLIPGAGESRVKVQITGCTKAAIEIKFEETLPYYPPQLVTANKHGTIGLVAKDATVISVEDSQHLFADVKVKGSVVHAKLVGSKGNHTVVLKVLAGKATQYRIYRINISDTIRDIKEASRFVTTIPKDANWERINISSHFNADIRTIYKQQYLTPRPNTVSVRLGTDGYSPWTFPYWKSFPPAITFDSLPKLLQQGNKLVTPQGVPFQWNTADKNIAFTSMWDNYPVKISIPVNKTGNAVWLLVAGSTNIMQCQIANAVIRLHYVNGQTDSLELIPPVNYWNLSSIDSHATAPGQSSRTDYTAQTDAFCMPKVLPETVRLGENCRAMLLNLKMRKGLLLNKIVLETVSQEVVIGLMGLTVLK